ncbi:hypothetical protein AtubIFM57143_007342 [Aspergillus tubingensis]|nr:hypothetical protein AtubIFM57143_007342 [Aspergillus tubingensis]
MYLRRPSTFFVIASSRSTLLQTISETLDLESCGPSPEWAAEVEALVDPVLKELEAFQESSVLPEYESSLPPSTQFPKLTTLIHYWRLYGDVGRTAHHVRGWLDLYCHERRYKIILLLRGCAAALQLQHPGNPPAREHRTVLGVKGRPSSVSLSANTVFQALFSSARACSHVHTHQSAARLRIATHRKHDHDRCRFEGLVTLSATYNSWQETHINVDIFGSPVKQRLDFSDALTHTNHSAKGPKRRRLEVVSICEQSRLEVLRLCEQIDKLRKMPSMCLNLWVEDGKLWKDHSLRIEHPIHRSILQVSLRDIIKNQPSRLTEKMKRVLSVLLAYSVLHLHGTPWLRPSNFRPDNIFFYGTSTAIPLKPYIHTSLAETVDNPEHTNQDGDVDPDDLPLHPYPEIVMLAVMLIELYVVQPLHTLASQFGVQECDNLESVDENTRYRIAIAAFDRFKDEFPDNYRQAVDKCLDPNIALGPDDEELSEQALKHLISESIVQPLEDELHRGFGNTVHIDKLDDIVQKMDLNSWGQIQPTTPSLPEFTAASSFTHDALRAQGITTPSEEYISGKNTSQRANFIHRDYTVGWICALPTELAAAQAVLDDIHPPLPQSAADQNNYTLGRIGSHNVVMACLPAGVIGTVSAARVADNMMVTFSSLKFGLLVGIGGGVPGVKDVRLGDVVVGEPTGPLGGIIQYDFGKTVPNGQFHCTGSLNRPPDVLLTAVSRLMADHLRKRPILKKYLTEIVERYPDMSAVYSHPGVEHDILFASDYDHDTLREGSSCDGCDRSKLVRRQPRLSTAPRIHYGLIASGNNVMRDSKTRDKLRDKHGILCFEMEAAGIVDSFRSLVIRGICDYSDSHKNKVWQGYAAAAAAAYAKELLSVIVGTQIDNSGDWTLCYGSD